MTGRTDLLELDEEHTNLIEERQIDLQNILEPEDCKVISQLDLKHSSVTELNHRIYNTFIDEGELHFELKSTDRAVGAFLMGEIARRKIDARKKGREIAKINSRTFYFSGSAGHAFGGFLQEPFHFFFKRRGLTILLENQ